MKIDSLDTFYGLTSDHVSTSHSKQLEIFAQKGVKLVQLRSKKRFSGNSFPELTKSVHFARSLGTKVIMNDSISLAMEFQSDGVHLGEKDSDPETARKMLGRNAIIGSTVHSKIDAEKVRKEKVSDYVGLGPFRESSTKRKLSPKLSIEEIKEIISMLQPIPTFLIGGLDENDFQLLEKTGAHGICVCSSLSNGDSFGINIDLFLEKKFNYVGHSY